MEFPQSADSDASLETAPDEPGAGAFGAIALCTPSYRAAKKQQDLDTLSFVFGRKTRGSKYADVWVTPNARLSRKGFGLAVLDGYWVVYSLGPSLEIHGDTLLESAAKFALHPYLANIIQWKYPIHSQAPARSQVGQNRNDTTIGVLELEIFVRQPERLTECLEAHESLPEDSFSSCMSEITAGTNLQQHCELPHRLYVFDHEIIGDQRHGLKFLSLDPWTRQQYVAKVHPKTDEQMLLDRIDFTYKLPRTQFICSDFVRIHDNKAFECRRYEPDLEPLNDWQPTLPAGRGLLWTLLRRVCMLHNQGIYHNDIRESTVLIDARLDPDSIRLAGFSEASRDSQGAIPDCFQVFKTVWDFIEPLFPLPQAWTGNEILDGLWEEFQNGLEGWYYTVTEVCQMLHLNLDRRDELWSSLPLGITIEMKCTMRGQMPYLDETEVEDYLRKDVVRCAGETILGHCRVEEHYPLLYPTKVEERPPLPYRGRVGRVVGRVHG